MTPDRLPGYRVLACAGILLLAGLSAASAQFPPAPGQQQCGDQPVMASAYHDDIGSRRAHGVGAASRAIMGSSPVVNVTRLLISDGDRALPCHACVR